MVDVIDGLEDFGFLRNEAKVYAALFGLKSATVGMVSRDTKVERHYAHDILLKLVKRGYATYVMRNRRKYYQPAGISRLAEIQSSKKASLDSVIPQLMEISNEKRKGAEEQNIAIYEGIGGIKMILDEALVKCRGAGVVGFGDNGMLGSELIPEFMKAWHKERIRNRIRIRSIFIDTPEALGRMKEASGLRLMKTKVLRGPLNHHLSAWISGDITIVWMLTDRPFAVMVNSQKVADGFRGYFEALWGIAEEK